MKLPNAESSVVPPEKITDYLLNPVHPDGAGKAQFFASMGFRREEWRTLAAALRRIGQENPVTESMESAHGRKYVIDGRMETAIGRRPMVRTIWIVDQGSDNPRLVSAYPQEETL